MFDSLIDAVIDFATNRQTAELLFWWAGAVLPVLTLSAIIFATACGSKKIFRHYRPTSESDFAT
jgi:hypothetical protein